jgi:hypothetical protein
MEVLNPKVIGKISIGDSVRVKSISGHVSWTRVVKEYNPEKYPIWPYRAEGFFDVRGTEPPLKRRPISRKEHRARMVKKYGPEVRYNYSKLPKRSGKYWLGMTESVARENLGPPKRINRSVGSWGTHEQWVYSNKNLYFRNGILSSYQN